MTTKRQALPVIAPRNPTRCHRIEDPEVAATVRRLDCQQYNACLDVAARKDWRGFHCGACSGFQAPTPTQQHRDMLASLRLLAETQVLALLATDEMLADEEGDETDELLDAPVTVPKARSSFLLDDDDTGSIRVIPPRTVP